ncbi:MAG: glutamine amidotransferase [Acidobacteria bacterium]|nr:glutamine amidotransferase [Acidobacteriota bacterium]
MKPVLIIKTGSTLPELRSTRGDFEDWIRDGLGLPPHQVIVADIRWGAVLPSPVAIDAAVITGSHHMVTERLDWSERTAGWLQNVQKTALPLLGICYGHQLLALAWGGRVADNPGGREYGTVEVQLTPAAGQDPLFMGIPASIRVQASHAQSVLELPPGALRLAGSRRDANQAFRLGPRAWGLQFHPEFDADITRTYIRHHRDELSAEGMDPQRLEEAVTPTPPAAGLLHRFAALVRESSAHKP